MEQSIAAAFRFQAGRPPFNVLMVSVANCELFMFLSPRKTQINKNGRIKRTMPYSIEHFIATTLPRSRHSR